MLGENLFNLELSSHNLGSVYSETIGPIKLWVLGKPVDTYNKSVVFQDVHFAHGTGSVFHQPGVNATSMELMPEIKEGV